MTFKLETEEELKEYIDNLGTEYKFSCFKEKDPEACHLLSDYLESIKKDYEGSAKVAQANCDERKHPKSCHKYATFSYLGKGCDVSNPKAFEYFKKACDAGYPKGCFTVGLMLSSPENDPRTNLPFMDRDYVAALPYLETACNSKQVPMSCFYAAGLYLKGAEGIPQNKNKAYELSKLACDGGHMHACLNVSQMYKKGDGVEKSEEKSNIYKEKAKELRDDARPKPSIGLQKYT